MAWPAPLPGRLLEAVGNRGPRGMTVAGRKLRTEPGLQAGFANFLRILTAFASSRASSGIHGGPRSLGRSAAYAPAAIARGGGPIPQRDQVGIAKPILVTLAFPVGVFPSFFSLALVWCGFPDLPKLEVSP